MDGTLDGWDGVDIRFQVMKETRIDVHRQKWFLVEDIEDAGRKGEKEHDDQYLVTDIS